MEIRFISSLTSEDEGHFASALIKAIAALLDQSLLTYTLRIETSGAKVYQHSHVAGTEGSATAGDSGPGAVVSASAGLGSAASIVPETGV